MGGTPYHFRETHISERSQCSERWKKLCLQSAIMASVHHPLNDKMSMRWSAFCRRLFPLRRAKKHFRSPSDCPPQPSLLPPQHQPLAPRFALSTRLQSVIYLFLQWAPIWFHPPFTYTNANTHTHTQPHVQKATHGFSTPEHKLWPHLLDLLMLLFLFVPLLLSAVIWCKASCASTE